MWWLLLPRTPTQAIEKKVLAQREFENGNKPGRLSRPVTNKYIHWWLTLFSRSSHHTSTSTRLQKHRKTENRFLKIILRKTVRNSYQKIRTSYLPKIRTLQHLLPVSRRSISDVAKAVLLTPIHSSLHLPSITTSGIWSLLLVTAAGPRRNCTDFSIKLCRAPLAYNIHLLA